MSRKFQVKKISQLNEGCYNALKNMHTNQRQPCQYSECSRSQEYEVLDGYIYTSLWSIKIYKLKEEEKEVMIKRYLSKFYVEVATKYLGATEGDR